MADLPGNAWGPRIATDGRSIVYSLGSGATPEQTFTAGRRQGAARSLPRQSRRLGTAAPDHDDGRDVGWSWSPDGKTLALTSNRDGYWEIYLLTFPGQELKRLTSNAAEDAWPNWTPDGKQLIFMSTRDGYPQLYRMNADGGGVTRLITSESADTVPVLSPDGKRLAYITQTVGANDTEIFVRRISTARTRPASRAPATITSRPGRPIARAWPSPRRAMGITISTRSAPTGWG